MKATVSQVYSSVNAEKEPSAYDYNNYTFKVGDINLYKITARIGRGKYSEVFEGKTVDKERIVIKVLKPVKQSKINREIMVLKHLSHKNILNLKDVVFDSDSEVYSLIFDYIKHIDTCSFFEKLNLNNISGGICMLLTV